MAADKEKNTNKREELNLEEMENVVGGSNAESAGDSKFLNNLLEGTEYYQCNSYDTKDLSGIFPRFEVMRSWNSIGIDVRLGENYPNKYILNGKEISRDEAWEHAKKTVGKY